MNHLLDTHSLIWFISGDTRLSTKARLLIEDTENILFVSIASLWEIAIKYSIGKLNLGEPFEKLFPRQLEVNSIEVLDITLEHLRAVSGLHFYHRDPFDRLLAAQAGVERLPIISADTIFDQYTVQRQW